jgi:hypothetical protein
MRKSKREVINETYTLIEAIRAEINAGQCAACPACIKVTELHDLLVELLVVIKDDYPLECERLQKRASRLVGSQKINPYDFGGIIELISLLKARETGEEVKVLPYPVSSPRRKIFISHSSEDEFIVRAFMDKILLLGCGLKPDDIFCTLDPTAIRTGDDFREQIIINMEGSDYILLFISENYKGSEVCGNELGAAWAFRDKRVLPFVLPNVQFSQMGFLNVVKQGAELLERSKLDEFYEEVCKKYSLALDWKNFNKHKDDFVNIVASLISQNKHCLTTV